MEPVKYDITVKQGASWSRSFTLKTAGVAVPIEAGWLGRAQLRRSYDGPLVGSFTVTITDHAAGAFTVSLPATALVGQVYARPAKGVWDLELYDPEDPTRVLAPLYGEVTIIPEVTK